MAISPGFDHDIFVSYAHVDNQEGWVTQFEDRLDLALRQRLGGAGKSLKIFFDREATGANYQLPTLLTAARRSALFLAIGSPSFNDSAWNHDELTAFTERTNDRSRIFLVEFLPLNQGDNYPAPIHDHIRLEFWKPGKYRHTPMWLSPTADAEDFASKIHTLAMDIREKLTSIRVLPLASVSNQEVQRGRHPVAAGTPNGRVSTKPLRTLLLAQGTDDVEDEAEQLRQFLSQYETEVNVLPAAGYPQGGDAFRAAVAADLAQAGLFVQILGKRAGRTPPDLLEGYTRCQFEAAKLAGIPIMQWRRPDLDVVSVSDSLHQAMLTAETVVASGLEAFKQQVLEWVRKPPPKAHVTRSSTVFINADGKDMEIAKEVERECMQKAIPTILPPSGLSPAATRQDLTENLTDCDILVFIYGDTTLDWIRGQLKFFNRVRPQRKTEPKLLAICSGPPPKGDIGISFPNAHLISCPDGWNLEPIRVLIASVEE